jgi:hypothetical protein
VPEQSAEPRPVERLSSFLKERGLGAEDLSELKQILNDLGVDDEPPGDENDAGPNTTPGPGPDYELEEAWAARKKITRRTAKRYRDEPDGLPYLLWGNRVWIHKSLGEDYIRRRIKYPNRRRGRGRKMRDAAR